jgi:hypothetical protein
MHLRSPSKSLLSLKKKLISLHPFFKKSYPSSWLLQKTSKHILIIVCKKAKEKLMAHCAMRNLNQEAAQMAVNINTKPITRKLDLAHFIHNTAKKEVKFATKQEWKYSKKAKA